MSLKSIRQGENEIDTLQGIFFQKFQLDAVKIELNKEI